MNEQSIVTEGNVMPVNDEKAVEFISNAQNVAAIEHGGNVTEYRDTSAAATFAALQPWATDIETLTLAAKRFRQSGKTTLARQLESIATNLGRSGHANHIVVKNDAEGHLVVTTQDLSEVPNYVATNGEVEKFNYCLAAGKNVLLTGPSGCGKTSLVEYVCKKLNRPLIEVQGGAGATFERLIGKDGLSERNGATVTGWENAILPLAMNTENCVLYFDEPNSIPHDVLFYLHPAMDHRRTITFADGRVLKAKAGFTVVGAMNEGYAGTAMLNAAFRQRFVSIPCDYLSQRREAKLLRDRCGASHELAAKLTKLAANLRTQAKTNKQMRTPIGTRSLMDAADLIRVGCPEYDAVSMALTEQVPAQYSVEKKAVSDAVTAYFFQQPTAATEGEANE